MRRYHFNPETGQSGACRAAPGNCPFLAQGTEHFDSLAEARRGYEEFQELPYVSSAARLVVMRSRVQRKIIALWADENQRSGDAIMELVKERNRLEELIHALPEKSSSDGEYSPSSGKRKLIHEEVAIDRGDHFVGIHNTEEDLLGRFSETYHAAFEISEEWLRSLSAEEAKAILRYSEQPNYAHTHGDLLSQAVAKAPRLEPTRVYSGLSKYVSTDVLNQAPSGKIELSYPISTSLNPAQANGFMETTLEPDNKLVAVEIETTRGGSMLASSFSPHEFEILLPAGSYEILERREQVQFLWEEGGKGRVADVFFRLRRIDD